MSEERKLHRDLFALFLLAFVLFLGVSLITYDAADPVPPLTPPLAGLYSPDVAVYPQNARIGNGCGKLGALGADLLLTGLGIGAYYLLISLAALDVLLLKRVSIDAPIVRIAGWLASLLGLTALASLLFPGVSPGPMIGPGGYLGALATTFLHQHFATLGSLILCTSLVVGGCLLCSDYALFRVAALAGRATVHSSRTIVRGVSGMKPGSLRASADVAVVPTDCEEDEEEALSVRIRGKNLVGPAVSDVDDEEEFDELDDAGELDVADEDDQEQDEYDAEEDSDDVQVTTLVKSDGSKVKKGREATESEPPIRKRTKQSDKDDVISSLNEAAVVSEPSEYELPSIELLIPGDDISYESQDKEVRRKAKILEQTFADFGFQVKVVEIETGPVIAQYEVQLEAGLRLSKITGLADDLAIALRVPSVRIVAPIPGKNTVGIEVPNSERQVVRLREVIEESANKTAKMRIPLFLGKDVSGRPLPVDLSTLPHLLIAGRTGTGKSVCLNAIICSILMTRRPDEVRLLLIDPKMVELSGYGRLPHLMHPVVTDMRKAEAILAWAVDKMEERYALLARAGVRHISSYNQLSEEELMERLSPETDEERKNIPLQLPFIVIVADEMADLMMTAGKEVEQHIIRLAQKSRAVGIHLILATQKPTVDVITGLIKSNLPARISFQVASRTDSRVVLDEMGADKLLGNGDMLFLWPGTSTLLRGQGTYLGDDEIERIVDAVSTGEQNFIHELVNIKVSDGTDTSSEELKKRDELYEQSIDIIVREGRGSVSLLQRALGIGYGRAARLIDYMEEDGIVGSYAGSQAREVLISLEDWESRSSSSATAPPPPAAAPPAPKRTNRIRPSAAGWDDEEREASAAANKKNRAATVQEEPDEYEAAYEEELEDEDIDEQDSLEDEDEIEDEVEDELLEEEDEEEVDEEDEEDVADEEVDDQDGDDAWDEEGEDAEEAAELDDEEWEDEEVVDEEEVEEEDAFAEQFDEEEDFEDEPRVRRSKTRRSRSERDKGGRRRTKNSETPKAPNKKSQREPQGPQPPKRPKRPGGPRPFKAESA